MDLGKQIFTQCVLLVLATDSFSLLAFFPPTIVSLSGLWEISGCSPCSVHKNLRSGPLVHLLRLFTPLEPLYHPDIMQNSALFHEAYSCLNKTFCSRIPSNLSKGPIFPWSPDFDLKQKGKGCWAFPGDTACRLNSGTPSIVPSSPLVTVLSPSVFLWFSLFKIQPEADNSSIFHCYHDGLRHHQPSLVSL